MLATPSFHHIHLNSVDPDASIDVLHAAVPQHLGERVGRAQGAGVAERLLVLFNKVDAPPPTSPQSAIWHFGWHVADTRRPSRRSIASPEVNDAAALFERGEGGSVLVSSDTWPSIGNTLGLTRAQIAEAQAERRRAHGRRRVFLFRAGRSERWSRSPATTRPSASTTCICGRRTRSAPCSGTRST